MTAPLKLFYNTIPRHRYDWLDKQITIHCGMRQVCRGITTLGNLYRMSLNFEERILLYNLLVGFYNKHKSLHLSVESSKIFSLHEALNNSLLCTKKHLH